MFAEERFNRYVLPPSPISAKASAVTGLHVVSGQLFHHKTRLESVDISTCLKQFNIWLKATSVSKPLLVCHNGKVFDSIIFMRSILKNPECGLKSTVAGFVDSLHVFRDALPGRPSYKLQTLVKETMGMTYDAHSALEDVMALQKLVTHHKISDTVMLKHSFETDFVVSSIENKDKTDDSLATLAPLASCISEYMLKKIARSGLAYHHLKLAIERGGVEGLRSILGERCENGSVRVTKNKTVVMNIYGHFC